MADPIGPQGDWRLVGKPWGIPVARMIQDFMREVRQILAQGLARHAKTHQVGGSDALPPAGTPLTVAAAGSADAGTGPGYMREDAQLVVGTAAPSVNVGASAPDAGVAATVLRSDARLRLGIGTTKGDILVFDGTLWNRLPVDTDGFVLTLDAAESLGLKWAAGGAGGGGGGGMLELVESHDFASDATNYSFASLDGDTDEVYFLMYRIVKAVAGAITVYLQPNGATTNQSTYGTYDGPFAGSFNSTTMQIVNDGTGTTDDVNSGQCWINAKTGQYRTARSNWANSQTAGGGVYAMDAASEWRETSTNITSLDVVCDVASGIKAGSYVRLYKLLKTAPAGAADVLTTKGDMLGYDTALARVPGPTMDGQVLTADAAVATGVKWAAPVDSLQDLYTRQSVEAYAVRDVMARTFR